MWRWLIALVAACAPKPAEPLEPSNNVVEVRATAARRNVFVASAPRPDIDVSHLIPDFHDELRWPLAAMSHPSLEPRFRIASVFAQPGVGWIELCERGAHKATRGGRNRDELEYLRGWCSAIKGDVDTACARLHSLARPCSA